MSKNIILLIFPCLLILMNACSSLNEIEFIEFKANFESPQVVRIGEPVEFRPSLSTSGAITYSWSFGDKLGQSSQEANPSFTYDSIGNYTIMLKVEILKDTGLVKDSIQKNIIVLPQTENPGDEQFYEYGQEIGSQRGSALYPISEGGFVIAGQKNVNTLVVTKVNANQEIMSGWPKEFNNFGTGQMFVRAVKETVNGGILIIGYFQYQSDDSDAFLLKISGQGNEVWRTIIRSDKDEKFTDVIEDPLGNLLIVGTFATSGRPSVVLNRYSAQGVLSEPYTVPRELCNSCTAEVIRRTQDGGFVIAGQQIESPMVMKFDLNGLFQGKSTLNTLSGVGSSIIQLQNGKYILVGKTIEANPDSSHAFIAQFDVIGNAEDWRQILRLYEEEFVDVWAAQNGDLVAVGTHHNPLSGRDALLGRFDRITGQTKQVRLISRSGNSRISKAWMTSEDDITLIGSMNSNTSSPTQQKIMLMKFTSSFWE
jgi:PKD repeat protein